MVDSDQPYQVIRRVLHGLDWAGALLENHDLSRERFHLIQLVSDYATIEVEHVMREHKQGK